MYPDEKKMPHFPFIFCVLWACVSVRLCAVPTVLLQRAGVQECFSVEFCLHTPFTGNISFMFGKLTECSCTLITSRINPHELKPTTTMSSRKLSMFMLSNMLRAAKLLLWICCDKEWSAQQKQNCLLRPVGFFRAKSIPSARSRSNTWITWVMSTSWGFDYIFCAQAEWNECNWSPPTSRLAQFHTKLIILY